MTVDRPDPDALLAAVQKDTEKQQRGKLKIFLGMAAGVGKTYAMLDAAQRLKADGVDVAVGYVETHKRPETEALLDGLEIIPRKRFEYRGTALEDMDTEAILVRKPALVLVDELAHTNPPDARHVKRYQDVIELLEAHIDVYTTVNVQHFESRTDTVQQITGIQVMETVPDSILDIANEIELIDLPPEDLRKRLAEGKVYTPERVEVAAKNFFRSGNLTALREMALRLTAEHVDHQLQDYMQIKRIAGPWHSAERLMVAVSPSPFSERLIRWTRRVAYNLEAPWLAVYVNTQKTLSAEDEDSLGRNLALARALGAEVITTAGLDVMDSLLHLARQRNVTQIVLGKPIHNKIQSILRGGSLVDRIIRHSGDIDIYVVTGDVEDTLNRPAISLPRPERTSSWFNYLIAVGIIAAITVVDLLIFQSLPWFGYEAVGLTDIFAILLIAIYLGRGPALAAALVSAVSWNFLFINPRFTLEINRLQDVLLFTLYFVVALLTGNLTARLRSQERRAQYNADRTMALYALAHQTATAVSMDDVLKTAVTQIGQVFNAEVAIFLPQGDKLQRQPHFTATLIVDDKEFSVALWAYENGKPAGHGTDTLPLSSIQALPLVTPERTVGVVVLRLREWDRLTFEQEALLETFTSQVALAIERELLDQAAEQSAVLRESERLYTALLNSISHELRTPIATIQGASSSLLEPNTAGNGETRLALIHDIQDAAARLNQLVANLLDMSRLDSGHLALKADWCDVGDIIGVAVSRMQERLAGRHLSLQVPPNLPFVKSDFVLIEHVLVNILDNAGRYTPAGTSIAIEAATEGKWVRISITDSGQGIAREELDRIFDKFYRGSNASTGGTGLGLSISKGLIEAHEGTITAENATGGGLRFNIRLPVAEAPSPAAESERQIPDTETRSLS